MRVNNTLLIWLMSRYRRKRAGLKDRDIKKKVRQTNVIAVLGLCLLWSLHMVSFELHIAFYTLLFGRAVVPIFLSFLLLAWRYQSLTTLVGLTTMSGEFEARARFINGMVFWAKLFGKRLIFFDVEGELVGSKREVLLHKTDASIPLYFFCILLATIDWLVNPLWSFHDVDSDAILISSEENLEKARNMSLDKLLEVEWYGE